MTSGTHATAPQPPNYESLLESIATAPSAADLAGLLDLARKYFAGSQREALLEAAEKRQSELPSVDLW